MKRITQVEIIDSRILIKWYAYSLFDSSRDYEAEIHFAMALNVSVRSGSCHAKLR